MTGNVREAILAAATTAAQLHGYSGINFRSIGEAVGVKNASIYYHFASKADLAAAVAERYWRDTAEALRSIRESNPDPLGCTDKPDLLLLLVSDHWKEELAALSSRPPSERPPVVVGGTKREAAVMRAAMRAGARDFFTHPVEPSDFAEILQEISVDKHAARPAGEPELTAVIGARGGVGTSMVSSNLAHILSRGFGMRSKWQ